MLQTMLAERAASNPQLGAMLQMMNMRQAEEPASKPLRSARVERVRDRVREMRDELVELRRRNEMFAAAVGACAGCWGEARDCGACGGDGAPGWLEPDLLRFNECVAPAVARLAGDSVDPDHGDVK